MTSRKITEQRIFLGCSIVAMLASANPVEAQTAGDAEQVESTNALEDIVVTARRRDESLQSVPVAVTALTGDMLETKGIATIADLNRVAPSLSIAPSGRGENTPTFTIRAQRQNDTGFTLDPGVVVYVNEAAYVRPQGLNGALFDVQSVQVLRGPQGTLFGRNSTGGAVLITTNPASDKLEGNVQLSYGSYDLMDAEGVLNLPLTDTLFVRIGAKVTSRDGYMRNVIAGPLNGREANDINRNAQRVSLRFEPSAEFDTNFVAERFSSRDNGSLNTIYAASPIGSFSNPTLFAVAQAQIRDNLVNRRYTFQNEYPGREATDTLSFSNITNIGLSDGIKLKNISSFRRIKTYSQWDFDGTSRFVQQIYGKTKGHQFSEEFHIIGNGTDYDWITGLYYFTEIGDVDQSFSRLSSSPDILRPSGVLDVRNTGMSAFGSGTYRFSDSLSLSAGLRYTKDTRKAVQSQTLINTATSVTTCNIRRLDNSLVCTLPVRVSYQRPTWSVSLNYQASPDALFYVAHRRGYRSGGVQNRVTNEAGAVPFRPETVDDIELGMKVDFDIGDMPVRVNADIFKAWYKGLQRTRQFVGDSGTQVSAILNAARGTVAGIEAEITLKPARNLELQASVSLLDPKYTSYSIPIGGVLTDLSYLDFSLAPRNTANGSITYTALDTSEGRVMLSANAHYQSSQSTADTPKPVGLKLPGYTIVNARLDWNNVMGSRFGASVFVNNLLDEYYLSFASNTTDNLGWAEAVVGAPRMFGVQGRFSF